MNRENASHVHITRLETAGLYGLSFFGYTLHMVIHNMTVHGMESAKLAEMAAVMSRPSMLAMFFVWNAATILPAFLSLILKRQKSWWFIAIFGTLILLTNTAHSIAHLIQGDIFNGSNTLVMQSIPMLWAVILSFRLARDLEG